MRPSMNLPEIRVGHLLMRCYSSTARAKGPAFDALVKLGPAIIPLVVKKLADPDNFFAIQLCKS